MDYLSDTTFLVGRWREGAASPEQRFIDQHPGAALAFPWVVKGEFLRGAVLAGHSATVVAQFLDRYRVVWPTEQTLHLYSETWAALARNRQMVGVHDLWIAVCALEHDLPLLTRNADEYKRVPKLRVVDYTQSPSASD
ncbi:MAG: type II toxin-antitoxin system VapC family toxin [Verrucomicrobiae bacterium]|nr:type II toxin-antitoxin system VapC family toxin [Verrucomicrobiae bacterium]